MFIRVARRPTAHLLVAIISLALAANAANALFDR
jgi:hypothetical protein